MATRLAVKKTYKLFIGGKFPRSESGRVLPFRNRKEEVVAHYAHASRKDFREAVVAARKAFPDWSSRTAYLRGQILYRVAEMLETRKPQFVEELGQQGMTPAAARREVDASVDRWVHYAGWTDKYSAVFSSVNPVASPHFNFSRPEPTGVIGVLAPGQPGLLGLAEYLGRILAGGNTAVLLSGSTYPLTTLTLGEILATSDLPAGVVNLLTGRREELVEPFAGHMDVNGLLVHEPSAEERVVLQEGAARNVKRLRLDSGASNEGDPYRILDFQEVKTTWHPVSL